MGIRLPNYIIYFFECFIFLNYKKTDMLFTHICVIIQDFLILNASKGLSWMLFPLNPHLALTVSSAL